MSVRQIVLDTETTGLEPAEGHRIIEIGCVELINRRVTGRTFHRYLNPERRIEQGAKNVHGITEAELLDKPRFREVVDDFLAFIDKAELVIHNAPFDVGFIEHELKLLNGNYRALKKYCHIVDTLVMARTLHPGQRNSLDALCKRYQVDNSQREWHGALLDAELLARVYLAMTGGQGSLFEEGGMMTSPAEQRRIDRQPIVKQQPLRVIVANAEERKAHEERLAAIRKQSGKQLWDDGEK